MFDTVQYAADFKFTPAVAKEAAPLYERVKRVVNELDWATYAPYILEINRLKKQMGAVILAHNYMTPEIFHCVSDFAGDSLQLAQQAAKVESDLIIQADEVVRVRDDMERILSRHTGQSVERLRADTDHDRVFTAQAAREYGLIDEVLEGRGPLRPER